MTRCWCGVEADRRHYPAGDPENGPAHMPSEEEPLRVEVLDRLAREQVGMTGSPFSFVTVEGRGIVAVFVDDLKGAIAYCGTLDPSIPAFVEDDTGVAWDNPASDALQRTEEEEDS